MKYLNASSVIIIQGACDNGLLWNESMNAKCTIQASVENGNGVIFHFRVAGCDIKSDLEGFKIFTTLYFKPQKHRFLPNMLPNL